MAKPIAKPKALNWNYTIDGEYHEVDGCIRAQTLEEATKVLSKLRPSDVGADAFFICPTTGDDIGIPW